MDNERMQKLLEQREGLTARIEKMQASEHAAERRRDTRRKIIAGAILLEAVQQDLTAESPTGIARWWAAQLARISRPQDKRLFMGSRAGQGPAERSAAASPTGD